MESSPTPPDAQANDVDAELARSLPVIEDRLQARFPSIPPQQIHDRVDEAVVRADSARIRHFLPILIERRVAQDLRAAS
jgi:hypothetical protein